MHVKSVEYAAKYGHISVANPVSYCVYMQCDLNNRAS